MNQPRLTILSSDEVEALHTASMRILEETGVRLNEPQSREMLQAAGARLDEGVVRIPGCLVEASILAAGKSVSVRGRGGAQKQLGDGHLYFHNLGGAPQVFDPVRRSRRLAVVKDVHDSTRLLDALERCHTITPFFTPTDVPGPIMSLAMYRHALPHTLKPVQGPGVQTAAEVKFAVHMAEVIGPPAETLTLSLSPVSPLTIPDHEALAILEIARHGIPFGPLPCPTAGTTAPFTLAGALAQQNAEILAALVLAQLVAPGLPMIYCGRLAMMEPRTGLSVWGGLEMGLASAATVQIGHRYGLPVNVYGFSTNAHDLDAQNGFERALNAILPALAGADELSGIGEMEAGTMGSYAQMVLDHEFTGSILRAVRGVRADADALAVEVIAAAMHGDRNFLTQKHTRTTLRSGEIFLTSLAERGSWESWESSGRVGMCERAAAEAERILQEHAVPELTRDQDTELERILQAASRELVH